MPWCRSGKVENAIQENNRTRLTYAEGVTVSKFVFKGADQIPPFECAWCWRGSSVQLKKSVWLMAGVTGGLGSDGTNINHPFDGGPVSTMSKVVQNRVEEM